MSSAVSSSSSAASSASYLRQAVEATCQTTACIPDFLPAHVFQNYQPEANGVGGKTAVTWLPETSFIFLLYYRNGGVELVGGGAADAEESQCALSVLNFPETTTQVAIEPETFVFFPVCGIPRKGLPTTAFRGNSLRCSFFCFCLGSVIAI